MFSVALVAPRLWWHDIYVALCRTPGTLGIPWPWFSYSMAILLAIFGGWASDALHPKHVILFVDVTSLMSAVTSYVTSQHCMCIGHVNFYYKRSTDPLVGVLACGSSIHQVRPYHQRPLCGWCLTGVGHDTSSVSPGWSLLPSNVIIVLALVNSAVSPAGT